MHTTREFILTLALAIYLADGLAFMSQSSTKTLTGVKTSVANSLSEYAEGEAAEDHPVVAQQVMRTVMHTKREVKAALVRPHAGQGPEKIKFSVGVINFYGTNLKAHTIALDIVMTLKWKDPRVVATIPAGLDQLTLPWEAANEQIWMPGIVVTNRDIRKYEIISSSVTIFRTGQVLRVERAQTRIMEKFDLADYPFDHQHLHVKLASSRYMSDEVVLVAEKKSFDVHEHIFGLYDVQGFEASVQETTDGELKKSRGVFDIVVKRSLGKYIDDHLVPALIAVIISWAVFYFPFAGPFITPRLALSILALLTFTNLMVKSAKELPGAAPFNWNDLFNQQIQTLMFLTIVFNIGTEIVYHQLGKEKLARTMNNQCKILLPSMSLINIVLILGSAKFGWMEIFTATVVTKLTIVFLFAGYLGYVYTNLSAEEAAAPK